MTRYREETLSHLNLSDLILVVTATDTETKFTHDEMRPLSGYDKIFQVFDDKNTYYIGLLGKYKVAHIQCGMGSVQRDSSLITVSNAIRSLNPNAIIMIGIAFGINSKDQNIGDILISKSIIPCDPKKIASGYVTYRGDGVLSSQILLNRLINAAKDWEYIGENGVKAKVISTPLLSSEILIDNKEFRDKLIEYFPNSRGGEMEGTGLSTACINANKDWIIIKAICDFADGKKAKNKRRKQETAMNSVLSFCTHLFNFETIFIELGITPYLEKENKQDQKWLENIDKIINNPSFNKINNLYVDLELKELQITETFPAEDDLFLSYTEGYNIDFSKIISNSCVIVGKGGTGKTTILKKITFDLSNQFKEFAQNGFPVYISLATYKVILGGIKYKIAEQLGLTIEKVDQLFYTKKFYLLLDGFDEIPLAEQKYAIEEIESLLSIKNVCVIITSREERYRNELNIPIYRIAKLNDDIIQCFASKYFNFLKMSQLTTDFWAKVSWEFSLNELARTPFYLILLIRSFSEKKDLPRNRGLLIDSYVNTLLKREKNKRTNKYSQEKLDLLMWLAIEMELKTQENYFDNQLISNIETTHRFNIHIYDLIDELRDSGLLVFENNNYYFAHQEIKDYFSARFIVRFIDSKIDFGLEPSNLFFKNTNQSIVLGGVKNVVYYLSEKNPKIVILASGLSSDPKKIIEIAELWDYQLASKCFGATSNFYDGELEQRIIENLVRIYRSPYVCIPGNAKHGFMDDYVMYIKNSILESLIALSTDKSLDLVLNLFLEEPINSCVICRMALRAICTNDDKTILLKAKQFLEGNMYHIADCETVADLIVRLQEKLSETNPN